MQVYSSVKPFTHTRSSLIKCVQLETDVCLLSVCEILLQNQQAKHYKAKVQSIVENPPKKD